MNETCMLMLGHTKNNAAFPMMVVYVASFCCYGVFFSSGDSNKQLGDKAIGIGFCVWRE